MKETWNKRYSEDEYNYGKKPNEFLKAELGKIEPGKILFIGEGEGRNAVYAATLGWTVDAIDYSEIGKNKAEKLADEFGVKINYQIIDFAMYEPTESLYDAVGIFFIHLEEQLRVELFQKIIKLLKPEGKIILECFEKEQINYFSGGPKDQAMLYSLEDIVNDFMDLEFEILSKEKAFLNEGKGHLGEGVVIKFVGKKT